MKRTRRYEHAQFLVIVLAIVTMSAVAFMSCGTGGVGDDGASGELCSQCGDDPDGPCIDRLVVTDEPFPAFCPNKFSVPTFTTRPTATQVPTATLNPPTATPIPSGATTVPPVVTPTLTVQPTVTAEVLATAPETAATPDACDIHLHCLRKLGSAQRRCYPENPFAGNALDLRFECDDARPNPNTVTERPETTTPEATLSPTPTFTTGFIVRSNDIWWSRGFLALWQRLHAPHATS